MIPCGVRESLASMGSVSILLPVLERLGAVADESASPSSSSSSSSSSASSLSSAANAAASAPFAVAESGGAEGMEGDAEGAAAVASQALACAMRIIAGVLHGHVSNCVDFCDSKGPSALSWLLVNTCGTLLRDINLSSSVGVVGAVAALLGAVAASRELTLAAAVNRRSGGGGGGRPQVRRSKASSAAVPVESIVLSLQHRMVEQLLGPGTWRAASAALQVNTTTSLVLIKISLSL